MNLGVAFPERLTPDVRHELEQIVAGVLASWSKEHNADGTHTGWTEVAFDANNFSGNGGMTWTLNQQDQWTFQYRKQGTTMDVALFITTSSVAAPSTALQVLIPGGYTASNYVAQACTIADNGTYETGFLRTTPGSRLIAVYRQNPATNWTASTNLTTVAGSIRFEVQ